MNVGIAWERMQENIRYNNAYSLLENRQELKRAIVEEENSDTDNKDRGRIRIWQWVKGLV